MIDAHSSFIAFEFLIVSESAVIGIQPLVNSMQ
jgi:hypothetical protein